MLEECTIENLYDLNETIARELFQGVTYPWEVLPRIADFIRKLGPTLDPEKFEKRGEEIWIAKSVKIAPTAELNGPLIIDEDTEVRQCAFIRGKAIPTSIWPRPCWQRCTRNSGSCRRRVSPACWTPQRKRICV